MIQYFRFWHFLAFFYAANTFYQVINKNAKNGYIKTYAKFKIKTYDKPLKVKRYILSGENKVKKLFTLIDGNDYYIFTIIGKNGERYDLEGDNLYRVISTSNIYETLNNLI